MSNYISFSIRVDWGRVSLAIVIALVAIATFKMVARSLRRVALKLESRAGDPAAIRRSVTLVTLSINALRYVIAFLAALMILEQLRVDTRPLLAGAGIFGLACAMGVQSLVKDIVSGFFMLFEGQLAVGDVVDLSGAIGVVEEVGLRVTKVRDAQGTVRYWPNGAIATVTNYSQGHFDYALTIVVACESEAKQKVAALGAIEAFQVEFDAFANVAIDATTVELPDGNRLLRVPLTLRPWRVAVTQQKLPPLITAALSELGLPPVAGREPSLTWIPPATK